MKTTVDAWFLHPGRPPRVSVCVTTFNHRQYLAEALESILMQRTDFPVEILLHDDCSTDGTTDVVRDYAARFPGRIRAFYQTENQYSRGRKALPRLCPLARGMYIALLEGDDTWTDPTKLAQQVAFLDTHPDCVMCYGNVRMADADGNVAAEPRIPPEQCGRVSPREMVASFRLMPTSTVMFRNVPELNRWMEGVNRVLNGDNYLFAMLAQRGGAGYVDIEPSIYRQHEGGIYSSLDADRRRAAKLRTLCELHARLDNPYRMWAAEAIARVYQTHVESLRREGRYRQALGSAFNHIVFELGRGSFSAAGAAAWQGLRHVRKMIARPRPAAHGCGTAGSAAGGAA